MPSPSTASNAILVVEDHELSALLIMEMLRTAFPERSIHLADTMRLAIAEFTRLQASLLVTDIGLPDGSGLDLTRRVVAADPQVRVVVYSMNDTAVMREGAAAAGAAAFVAKADPAELIRVVGDLLLAMQMENSPRGSPECPTGADLPAGEAPA
ncbi:response regulator [Caenimonas terrae]|uniref:Response regulator n=1 Tax=Caenimonas terrae TaxID=696074 RepID=A0ABW0NGG9_9BURK